MLDLSTRSFEQDQDLTDGERRAREAARETVQASKVNLRSHEIPHGVLHAAYLHQRRIAFRASAGTRDV